MRENSLPILESFQIVLELHRLNTDALYYFSKKVSNALPKYFPAEIKEANEVVNKCITLLFTIGMIAGLMLVDPSPSSQFRH